MPQAVARSLKGVTSRNGKNRTLRRIAGSGGVQLRYASIGQCKIIRGGIGLFLAEGYLNRRLFGDMLGRLSALLVPGG